MEGFQLLILLSVTGTVFAQIQYSSRGHRSGTNLGKDDNAPTEKCPKGLRHKDDQGCNSCYCNPQTGLSACTKMSCFKYPTSVLPVRSATKRCPRGLSFKQDCNSCHCNPKTGLEGCTRMACFQKPITIVSDDSRDGGSGVIRVPSATERCPKGLIFRKDCNSCHCNPTTGLEGCTRKFCFTKPILIGPARPSSASEVLNNIDEDSNENDTTQLQAPSATQRCPKGLSFKDDCNTCHCNPENGVVGCTMMYCVKGPSTLIPPPPSATQRCPKGLNFKDDCNSCHCNPKNGRVACTSKYCVRKPIPIVPAYEVLNNVDEDSNEDDTTQLQAPSATQRCPKGLSFKDDCNTCHCNPENGVVGCTMMYCVKGPSTLIPPPPSATQRCPKGLNFKDDCNSCHCNPKNGLVGCTKKFCMKNSITVVGKPGLKSAVYRVVESNGEDSSEEN